jgi:hypothetical protein
MQSCALSTTCTCTLDWILFDSCFIKVLDFILYVPIFHNGFTLRLSLSNLIDAGLFFVCSVIKSSGYSYMYICIVV